MCSFQIISGAVKQDIEEENQEKKAEKDGEKGDFYKDKVGFTLSYADLCDRVVARINAKKESDRCFFELTRGQLEYKYKEYK